MNENGSVTQEEKRIFLNGYLRGYKDAVSESMRQFNSIEKAFNVSKKAPPPVEEEEPEEAAFTDEQLVDLKEHLEAEQADVEDPKPPPKKRGRPRKKTRAKRKTRAARPEPSDPAPSEIEDEVDTRPAHERLADAVEKDPNLAAILGI